MIYLIAAISEDRVIGVNNDLPWHEPEDLKFFAKTTKGSTVVMGRKTVESLKMPLLGRYVLGVSRTRKGVGWVSSLEEGISQAFGDTYIAGGAEVYQDALSKRLPDTLILTRIPMRVGEGVKMPEIPMDYRCVEVLKEGRLERQVWKKKNPYLRPTLRLKPRRPKTPKPWFST